LKNSDTGIRLISGSSKTDIQITKGITINIAEIGNLLCKCGNRDIELVLLPDRVLLKCKICGAEKTIRAASNEDLKDTMIKRHILLSSENSKIEEGKLYTIIKD
jgi:hypothetical protein